jgi:hypothetical protein
MTEVAVREDIFFALFSVVPLDHANSAERLRESSRDFGIDLAALTKNRSDGSESFVEREAKAQQESKGDDGHEGADAKQHHQSDSRSHHASDQIDQACADQIADALDIRHDARDKGPALSRIVERDWKPANVRLHPLTKFCDQALRGF